MICSHFPSAAKAQLLLHLLQLLAQELLLARSSLQACRTSYLHAMHSAVTMNTEKRDQTGNLSSRSPTATSCFSTCSSGDPQTDSSHDDELCGFFETYKVPATLAQRNPALSQCLLLLACSAQLSMQLLQLPSRYLVEL